MQIIKRILRSLKNRPWLVAGSLVLIVVWFWEKKTIRSYEEGVSSL